MPRTNVNSAYSSVQNMGGNPRATEARAFMEAARRLSEAQKQVDTAPDSYRAALRLNWRLWTIIQSDVSGPDNVLPNDLKANVISLSIFVDKQTLGALSEPAAEKLDVLININHNLASGLMTNLEESDRNPTQVASTAVPSESEPVLLKDDIVT